MQYQNIEKISFKVVQIKYLAMHSTNRFDIFTVGNLLNILMEHDLYDCHNDMSVRMREGRDEARTQVQEKWVFNNNIKKRAKKKKTPRRGKTGRQAENCLQVNKRQRISTGLQTPGS